MKKNNKKGFTIVELVIVIAVIAILAAVLIPTFTGVTERAKENAAMQNARNAWTEYMTEHADKADYEENICIKSTVDDKVYYFHVKNGEFETKAVADHDSCTYEQATVDNGKLVFTTVTP